MQRNLSSGIRKLNKGKKLNGKISARFSSDGTLTLFESSGDIFLAQPMDNPGVNLTNTPDRLENTPQWLQLNTLKIVFNSKGVNEVQEKGWDNNIPGYLSMMNTDGSEYTVGKGKPYSIHNVQPFRAHVSQILEED